MSKIIKIVCDRCGKEIDIVNSDCVGLTIDRHDGDEQEKWEFCKECAFKVKHAIIKNIYDCKDRQDEQNNSLIKICDDYGLTAQGLRHAIEAYQDIICEITGGKLSKLTYDASFVLEEAEEYYKWKYAQEEEQDEAD